MPIISLLVSPYASKIIIDHSPEKAGTLSALTRLGVKSPLDCIALKRSLLLLNLLLF